MTKICLSIEKQDADFELLAQKLSALADVQVVGLDNYSLRDVDVFIGKKMSPQKLAEANKLKAVFAYKTGVEDFPLAQLAEHKVLLANSHADSAYIAGYAFSLALCTTARIAEFDRQMRLGDWCAQNPCWDNLFDMKVGLVGYGHIGKEIGKILLANNIDTYTLNRGKSYNVKTVGSLQELCNTCDLLILSLPATPQTEKMFNKQVFGWLKGKYIVNVGRSNCLDEEAFYTALSTGVLKGAGVDTWRQKPVGDQKLLPFDYPFEKLPNLVLSSHKAMQVADGHTRYVMDVLKNVTNYLADGTIANLVDCSKGY